jgi:hypothetical protein
MTAHKFGLTGRMILTMLLTCNLRPDWTALPVLAAETVDPIPEGDKLVALVNEGVGDW